MHRRTGLEYLANKHIYVLTLKMRAYKVGFYAPNSQFAQQKMPFH